MLQKSINNTDSPWLAQFERKFVTKNLVVKNFDDIKSYFVELENRKIHSEEDLIKFLHDYSEVLAISLETRTAAYIDMTRFVNDNNKKEAYIRIVKDLEPNLAKWENILNKKYINSEFRISLKSRPEYQRLDKIFETSLQLFNKKNIDINVRLKELAQQYEMIFGSMTINFDNSEKTIRELALYLKNNDQKVRKSAYLAIFERRISEKDKLEDIFDEMVQLRNQLADNLSLDNFVDYSFQSKLRDYSYQDCLNFHNSIEKKVLPIAKNIFAKRKKLMNLDRIAIWDIDNDPRGGEPLKPFNTADELFNAALNIFGKVDSELMAKFRSLESFLDLESRKGKAQGGYQATYDEMRVPFIFTNAIGLQDDLNTLLHEAGHAFHTLECRDNPLIWYRHSSIEFAEVASMSMELIGYQFLDSVYSDSRSVKRILQEKFESIVTLLLWIARVDAFQCWLYTNKNHNRETRYQYWVELANRFNPGIDYSLAPEDALGYAWHGQLHIFTVPLYYIEYAIAMLGALQLFNNYLVDPNLAIKSYKNSLKLGGQEFNRKLFESASIKFDFSEQLLGDLLEKSAKELYY
ncbi:MAG: M3 family oligoendopeptidase [Nitrospinota bacterium]